FTRKLYTMQGQKAFEEIRKRYRADGDFRRTVDRYIGEFERLLEEGPREGPEGVERKPQALPRRRRFPPHRRSLYRRVRAAARGGLARGPRPDSGAHVPDLGDGQGRHDG